MAYILSANGFRAGAADLGGAAVQTVAGRWPIGATGAAAAGTKYSPLGQIDASNVSKLHITWSWGAKSFGLLAKFNWE